MGFSLRYNNKRRKAIFINMLHLESFLKIKIKTTKRIEKKTKKSSQNTKHAFSLECHVTHGLQVVRMLLISQIASHWSSLHFGSSHKQFMLGVNEMKSNACQVGLQTRKHVTFKPRPFPTSPFSLALRRTSSFFPLLHTFDRVFYKEMATTGETPETTWLTQIRLLYESGKYSGFTVVCEGKTFRLHKMIVCPRSPVFAAALDGKFKVNNSDKEGDRWAYIRARINQTFYHRKGPRIQSPSTHSTLVLSRR